MIESVDAMIRILCLPPSWEFTAVQSTSQFIKTKYSQYFYELWMISIRGSGNKKRKMSGSYLMLCPRCVLRKNILSVVLFVLVQC